MTSWSNFILELGGLLKVSHGRTEHLTLNSCKPAVKCWKIRIWCYINRIIFWIFIDFYLHGEYESWRLPASRSRSPASILPVEIKSTYFHDMLSDTPKFPPRSSLSTSSWYQQSCLKPKAIVSKIRLVISLVEILVTPIWTWTNYLSSVLRRWFVRVKARIFFSKVSPKSEHKCQQGGHLKYVAWWGSSAKSNSRINNWMNIPEHGDWSSSNK